MNVTLILYESKYGTGEKIAKTLCPILGPAKTYNIEYAPENIKYYSNIVFLFSLYGNDGGKKIVSYINENSIDLSKLKVGIICVGLNKQDGLKKIEEFKKEINKKDTYDCFMEGELILDKLSNEDKEKVKVFCKDVSIPFENMGDFKMENVLESGRSLREFFNTPNFIPPVTTIQKEIEKFVKSKNTCALATGYGEFVRVTPIEYEYNEGKFYIISEGGLKFIGITQNEQVSLGIYENYTDMNNLCGIQITGKVEVIEAWTEEYLDVLERKGLKIEAVSKLPFNMNILKITPIKYEYLYSKFKHLGYDSKQVYIPKD